MSMMVKKSIKRDLYKKMKKDVQLLAPGSNVSQIISSGLQKIAMGMLRN